MTKIHSPAGFFLSFSSENKRPAKQKSVLKSPVIQKFKCTCSAIHNYSNVNVVPPCLKRKQIDYTFLIMLRQKLF